MDVEQQIEHQKLHEATKLRSNPTILKLPRTVINRIAAGEIVQRPSGALKELIENSIDANASNISINIQDGGIKELKIIDNGQGIHPVDYPMLCERFATSKLSSYNDLMSIATFGFRGEALSSLTYVSTVNITSQVNNSAKNVIKHRKTAIDWNVCVNGVEFALAHCLSNTHHLLLSGKGQNNPLNRNEFLLLHATAQCMTYSIMQQFIMIIMDKTNNIEELNDFYTKDADEQEGTEIGKKQSNPDQKDKKLSRNNENTNKMINDIIFNNIINQIEDAAPDLISLLSSIETDISYNDYLKIISKYAFRGCAVLEGYFSLFSVFLSVYTISTQFLQYLSQFIKNITGEYKIISLLQLIVSINEDSTQLQPQVSYIKSIMHAFLTHIFMHKLLYAFNKYSNLYQLLHNYNNIIIYSPELFEHVPPLYFRSDLLISPMTLSPGSTQPLQQPIETIRKVLLETYIKFQRQMTQLGGFSNSSNTNNDFYNPNNMYNIKMSYTADFIDSVMYVRDPNNPNNIQTTTTSSSATLTQISPPSNNNTGFTVTNKQALLPREVHGTPGTTITATNMFSSAPQRLQALGYKPSTTSSGTPGMLNFNTTSTTVTAGLSRTKSNAMNDALKQLEMMDKKQNQRNIREDTNHCTNVVSSYAMHYPQIAITLSSRTTSDKTARDASKYTASVQSVVNDSEHVLNQVNTIKSNYFTSNFNPYHVEAVSSTPAQPSSVKQTTLPPDVCSLYFQPYHCTCISLHNDLISTDNIPNNFNEDSMSQNTAHLSQISSTFHTILPQLLPIIPCSCLFQQLPTPTILPPLYSTFNVIKNNIGSHISDALVPIGTWSIGPLVQRYFKYQHYHFYNQQLFSLYYSNIDKISEDHENSEKMGDDEVPLVYNIRTDDLYNKISLTVNQYDHILSQRLISQPQLASTPQNSMNATAVVKHGLKLTNILSYTHQYVDQTGQTWSTQPLLAHTHPNSFTRTNNNGREKITPISQHPPIKVSSSLMNTVSMSYPLNHQNPLEIDNLDPNMNSLFQTPIILTNPATYIYAQPFEFYEDNTILICNNINIQQTENRQNSGDNMPLNDNNILCWRNRIHKHYFNIIMGQLHFMSMFYTHNDNMNERTMNQKNDDETPYAILSRYGHADIVDILSSITYNDIHVDKKYIIPTKQYRLLHTISPYLFNYVSNIYQIPLPLLVQGHPYHFILKGYISHHTKKNLSLTTSNMSLFVNNRQIEHKVFKNIFDRVFGDTYKTNYWSYLSITLPGNEIDVNVHPNKSQVHFLYEAELMQLLSMMIQYIISDNSMQTMYVNTKTHNTILSQRSNITASMQKQLSFKSPPSVSGSNTSTTVNNINTPKKTSGWGVSSSSVSTILQQQQQQLTTGKIDPSLTLVSFFLEDDDAENKSKNTESPLKLDNRDIEVAEGSAKTALSPPIQSDKDKLISHKSNNKPVLSDNESNQQIKEGKISLFDNIQIKMIDTGEFDESPENAEVKRKQRSEKNKNSPIFNNSFDESTDDTGKISHFITTDTKVLTHQDNFISKYHHNTEIQETDEDDSYNIGIDPYPSSPHFNQHSQLQKSQSEMIHSTSMTHPHTVNFEDVPPTELASKPPTSFTKPRTVFDSSSDDDLLHYISLSCETNLNDSQPAHKTVGANKVLKSIPKLLTPSNKPQSTSDHNAIQLDDLITTLSYCNGPMSSSHRNNQCDNDDSFDEAHDTIITGVSPKDLLPQSSREWGLSNNTKPAAQMNRVDNNHSDDEGNNIESIMAVSVSTSTPKKREQYIPTAEPAMSITVQSTASTTSRKTTISNTSATSNAPWLKVRSDAAQKSLKSYFSPGSFIHKDQHVADHDKNGDDDDGGNNDNGHDDNVGELLSEYDNDLLQDQYFHFSPTGKKQRTNTQSSITPTSSSRRPRRPFLMNEGEDSDHNCVNNINNINVMELQPQDKVSIGMPKNTPQKSTPVKVGSQNAKSPHKCSHMCTDDDHHPNDSHNMVNTRTSATSMIDDEKDDSLKSTVPNNITAQLNDHCSDESPQQLYPQWFDKNSQDLSKIPFPPLSPNSDESQPREFPQEQRNYVVVELQSLFALKQSYLSTLACDTIVDEEIEHLDFILAKNNQKVENDDPNVDIASVCSLVTSMKDSFNRESSKIEEDLQIKIYTWPSCYNTHQPTLKVNSSLKMFDTSSFFANHIFVGMVGYNDKEWCAQLKHAYKQQLLSQYENLEILDDHAEYEMTMNKLLNLKNNQSIEKNEEKNYLENITSIIDELTPDDLLAKYGNDEHIFKVLVQYNTSLFVIDMQVLSFFFIYRLCLQHCANFKYIYFTEPVAVQSLLSQAVYFLLKYEQCADIESIEELVEDVVVDENSIYDYCYLLYEKKELLKDFFSIIVDINLPSIQGQNGNGDDYSYTRDNISEWVDNLHIFALPNILPQYVPPLAKLPIFLLQLVTQINYDDEYQCIEQLSIVLGSFYQLSADGYVITTNNHLFSSTDENSEEYSRELQKNLSSTENITFLEYLITQIFLPQMKRYRFIPPRFCFHNVHFPTDSPIRCDNNEDEETQSKSRSYKNKKNDPTDTDRDMLHYRSTFDEGKINSIPHPPDIFSGLSLSPLKAVMPLAHLEELYRTFERC